MCDKVRLPYTYLTDQPPPPLDSKDNKSNKSKVVLGVEIFNILHINEVSSLIKLQFKLILTWRDPRLHFIDLKEHTHQNVISEKQVKQIWHPVLVLVNTIDKEQTIVRVLGFFQYEFHTHNFLFSV